MNRFFAPRLCATAMLVFAGCALAMSVSTPAFAAAKKHKKHKKHKKQHHALFCKPMHEQTGCVPTSASYVDKTARNPAGKLLAGTGGGELTVGFADAPCPSVPDYFGPFALVYTGKVAIGKSTSFSTSFKDPNYYSGYSPAVTATATVLPTATKAAVAGKVTIQFTPSTSYPPLPPCTLGFALTMDRTG